MDKPTESVVAAEAKAEAKPTAAVAAPVAAEAPAAPAEGAPAEGAPAEGAAARSLTSEDKPRGITVKVSERVQEATKRVQDAGKKAIETIKEALAKEIDDTPTPSIFASVQADITKHIQIRIERKSRSLQQEQQKKQQKAGASRDLASPPAAPAAAAGAQVARKTRSLVGTQDALKILFDTLVESIVVVERIVQGRIKSERGNKISLELEHRNALAVNFTRVSAAAMANEHPAFRDAWEIFRHTAPMTVDAIVDATKGSLKINAFDDAPVKRSCVFF